MPDTAMRVATGVKSKRKGLTPPKRYSTAFDTISPCTVAPITETWWFDNDHALKSRHKGKCKGRRVAYDHMHKSGADKGIDHAYSSVQPLIEDSIQRSG